MAVNRRLAAMAVLVSACVGIARSAPAQLTDRGEALFQLCASCHGPEAGGNRTFLAPAIAGMPEWYVAAQLRKFRSGLRGTHFDDLSGMRMRPMALTLPSEEDVDQVARYVATLPPTTPEPEVAGGDPARGQALYALCGSCHGARGEGMQPLNGPPLAHASDWYLLEQLQKFRAGVRGANPADPIAILMRPMALSLADEQALKDVVAYITTLSE
jgi:cytochrome c553